MARVRRNMSYKLAKLHDRRSRDLPFNAAVVEVEVDIPLALDPDEKIMAMRSIRNDPLGREVVEMINRGRCRELLSELMDGEFHIRRCQANVLLEGSFIGRHIDTYSNLDYRYSCVIQFGEQYEGGEFFIDQEGTEREIRTGYADVLVNRCEVPHGVRRVTGGNRTSLVFFLSKSPLSEPNTNHKQI